MVDGRNDFDKIVERRHRSPAITTSDRARMELQSTDPVARPSEQHLVKVGDRRLSSNQPLVLKYTLTPRVRRRVQDRLEPRSDWFIPGSGHQPHHVDRDSIG